MKLLRKYPGLRLAVKLFLIDLAIGAGLSIADDEGLPARQRMDAGRKVLLLLRAHRRLYALRSSTPKTEV